MSLLGKILGSFVWNCILAVDVGVEKAVVKEVMRGWLLHFEPVTAWQVP